MKKVLALVLAFAMVFSTITVAFAEGEVSEEAKALATLGMLEGDGSGVTVEYTSKQLTRLSAAAALLKLKGLYEEAIAFEGEDNFADVKDYAWVEGRNLMAYLKANPGLGFGGDENGNFNPGANIDEKSYYKVLLETLGYKQTTADVAGDFAWEEVMVFAESVGLEPVNAEVFTVDALAKATVAALKANTKEGKPYIETLVEAGKVSEEAAVAVGLMEEAPEVTVAVDSATALGNTVVEVTFEDDVDEEALENAEYVIEDLEVEEVVVTGSDTVRLTTEPMTSGKVYTLTVGEDKVKFTGVGKVSGAPSIKSVVSEDVEEVVITFDKNIDFETGSDVENYTISGVEVVEAVVDGAEVTLTTEGLASRKQYTVKVTGVESVDGGVLRSASKSFYTRPDTSAPKVSKVEAETNQRVIVLFNEEVTKETAEDISNYTIKTGDTELAVLEAKLVKDEEDEEEKQVELTTEVQTANKRYEITISNISDTTKAGNVMPKEVKKTFYGKKEDTSAPSFKKASVVSRNHIEVEFRDNSRFDEDSLLDANNYELTKSSEDVVVEYVEKVSYKDGVYKVLLTTEDLGVGGYSLKIYDIADEFGNVLEEKKTTVNVKRDTLAAATVSKYEVTAEDAIKVKFTKPLNEATAEDVSNYEFDNDIGAPVKVTYDSDDYSVKIETVEFEKGKTYKLTIDGVEDLAGNVLDLDFKFVAVKGEVDEKAPELIDVYAMNKYVVAVVFDEEVEYENAELKFVGYNEVFKAKTTSEDGTVVEFSNVVTKTDENGNIVIDDAKSAVLTGDEYNIEDITGISDVFGNGFEFDEEEYEGFVVYGTNEEPEPVEVLNITQTNAKTFEITMSDEVKADGRVTANGTTFEFIEDDDDKTIVYLEAKRNIREDDEFKIDLSKFITDKHGIPVANLDEDGKYTVFYAEYEDDESPYIVNVVAVDRYTIEIEYSEELSPKYKGSYAIKNADESVSKSTITPKVDLDGDTVKLTVTKPLEARYDYVLIIREPAKDVAGNEAEEEKGDEFYFNGTDLEPVDDAVADQKAVEEEAMKYMTSVTIEADDEKVANNVYFDLAQLKANKQAANDVTVVVKVDDDEDSYLDHERIDGTKVALEKLPDNEAKQAEQTVVLEFSKGDAKTTLEVTVTIKNVTAQEEE